jgi:hypothetical protein
MRVQTKGFKILILVWTDLVSRVGCSSTTVFQDILDHCDTTTAPIGGTVNLLFWAILRLRCGKDSSLHRLLAVWFL